ncbi:MAG: tetratricopeptide repeat protein [Candidatus Krumholzibacteria bacterium]|nr:tetratricopeptide repeat protein [Candidatus Krumholzibacteria bacterium]
MDHSCDNGTLLAAYLDRTLDVGERRSCEEHLAKCARCRAELIAIDAELEEMGLNRAAREALSRRAIGGRGERGSSLVLFVSRAIAGLRARGRSATAAAAIACVAIAAIVAGAVMLPRLVPSWDPDLRRGKANLVGILAEADIGDMRLAGRTAISAEYPTRLRGAGAPVMETFDRTEALLQKALLRHPENSEAYRMLGDLYMAGGEPHRAANVYRRALLRRSDDPALLNDLAVALFRSGELAGSREALERAFKGVDAPVEICYNLAVVWRESGDREEMKRYIELYLAKDRISPWAVKAQRMLSE